jgi:hypothetical protein
MSSALDAAATKRMSMNAASPTPAVRPSKPASRPSSLLRVGTYEYSILQILTVVKVTHEIPYETTGVCRNLSSVNAPDWHTI